FLLKPLGTLLCLSCLLPRPASGGRTVDANDPDAVRYAVARNSVARTYRVANNLPHKVSTRAVSGRADLPVGGSGESCSWLAAELGIRYLTVHEVAWPEDRAGCCGLKKVWTEYYDVNPLCNPCPLCDLLKTYGKELTRLDEEYTENGKIDPDVAAQNAKNLPVLQK
ncbi:MAG TPA: hypothetical protein DDX01_06910, partial [Holosporales bacterium]|nr:hypothetical protein [Holosporales bacterium]HCC25461.1 hypothetical protein [Holosporales bacterium]